MKTFTILASLLTLCQTKTLLVETESRDKPGEARRPGSSSRQNRGGIINTAHDEQEESLFNSIFQGKQGRQDLKYNEHEEPRIVERSKSNKALGNKSFGQAAVAGEARRPGIRHNRGGIIKTAEDTHEEYDHYFETEELRNVKRSNSNKALSNDFASTANADEELQYQEAYIDVHEGPGKVQRRT